MSLDKTKTKETLPTPEEGLSSIDITIVLEAVIRQLETTRKQLMMVKAPLPLTCRVSLSQSLLKEALEALQEMK